MSDTFPDKHTWAERTFNISWTDSLDSGETVAGSTWEIEGDDDALTKSNEAISGDGLTTSVKLAGGTDGLQYIITNKATTSASRKLTAVKRLNIRDTPR